MKLVVLTGQLGSGKTTLLTDIVGKLSKDVSYSIIINEFAASGIDSKGFKEKAEELTGGCVCCTKGEELLTAISKRKDKDVVFVETTGVASLNQLLKTLLENDIKPSNVILLIDAYKYSKFKKFSVSSKKQLSKATTVIITKSDLVSASDIKEVTRDVKKYTSGKIITSEGSVSNGFILQEHSFKTEKKDLSIFRKVLYKLFPELKLDKESKHIQKEGVKSISISTDKEISKEQVENLLDKLPGSVVRAKGLLKSGYKFNYVDGLTYFENLNNVDKTQLVFIGKMSFKDKYKLYSHVKDLTNENFNPLYKTVLN